MHRRVTISCLAAVISLAAPIAVQDSAHACDVASGACDSQGRRMADMKRNRIFRGFPVPFRI